MLKRYLRLQEETKVTTVSFKRKIYPVSEMQRSDTILRIFNFGDEELMIGIIDIKDDSPCFKLISTSKNLFKFPNDQPCACLYLKKGISIIWIKDENLLPNDFKVNGRSIQVFMKPLITIFQYQKFLEDNIELITSEIHSFKDINNISKKMQKYFENIENEFIKKYKKTEIRNFSKSVTLFFNLLCHYQKGVKEKLEFYLEKVNYSSIYKYKKEAFEEEKQKIIKLYQINKNELMANVKIPEIKKENRDLSSIETIILLDRMSKQTLRIVNKILPLALKKLGYKKDSRIKLVTYDSIEMEYFEISIEKLKMIEIDCRGDCFTCMTDAIEKIQDIFTKIKPNKSVRIMTISYGYVHDSEFTIKAVDDLRKYIEGRNILVNSQVFSFYKWKGPDIHNAQMPVKCCPLRWNNVNRGNLKYLEFNTLDDDIATLIAEQFNDDGLDGIQILKSTEKNILLNPWDNEATDMMKLLPGENVFWIKGNESEFKINKETIEIWRQPQLTISDFHKVMERNFTNILSDLRIRKIVDFHRPIPFLNDFLCWERAFKPTSPREIRNNEYLCYFKKHEKQLFKQSIPDRKVSKLFKEITKKKMIKVYPIKENEFIAIYNNKISSPEDTMKTILIIDCYQSKKLSTNKIINEVIPNALEKFTDKKQEIYVIIYGRESTCFKTKIDQLSKLDLNDLEYYSRICTAIDDLEKLLTTFDDGSSIRLLTVTSGQFCDRLRGENYMEHVVKLAKSKDFKVISQVLLMSQYSNGSTLRGLIDINNSNHLPHTLEILELNRLKEVSAEIADMFLIEYRKKKLTSNLNNLRQLPWQISRSNIPLVPGKNILWMTEIPRHLLINGHKIDIQIQSQIDLETFQAIVEENFDSIKERIRYFKRMNNPNGQENIRKLKSYFKNTEEKFILKKSNLKVSNLISTIE